MAAEDAQFQACLEQHRLLLHKEHHRIMANEEAINNARLLSLAPASGSNPRPPLSGPSLPRRPDLLAQPLLSRSQLPARLLLHNFYSHHHHNSTPTPCLPRLPPAQPRLVTPCAPPSISAT